MPTKFTTDRMRIKAGAESNGSNWGKRLEKYPEKPMATADRRNNCNEYYQPPCYERSQIVAKGILDIYVFRALLGNIEDNSA